MTAAPRTPVSVLVLEKYAQAYADALCRKFPALTVHTAANRSDIAVPLEEIDVLVAFGIAIDDALMKGACRLSWIQSLATGIDHFLKSPGLRRETLLTSARGIHGAPMRETVALLLLGVTRNIQRLVDNKHAKRWERGAPWSLLAGKTALVVGSGVSGSAIGGLLRAFGMTTIAATRTPRPIDGFDHVIDVRELVSEVAEVDVLVDVLPGGPAYENTISRAVFAAMRSTAVFINVGRGETVDEEALIDVLQRGRIAGAGLDVVRHTPLSPKSPLWDMPNVMLSPHIGGYFAEYDEHMMPILLANMELFLAGRGTEMRNLVEH